MHCGCGLRMTTHSLSSPAYHYYVCQQRARNGRGACPNSKFHRAEPLEQRVWGFVSRLLSDAHRLKAGLDKMIEEEQASLHTDPDQEAEVWVENLAEANRKRSGFQDMAAEGLITFDELRAKLAELEEIRAFAQLELEALEDRRLRLRDLERDKATLLESYTAMVPKALDNLPPEKRRHVYQMLRLRAVVASDGNVEVTGAFSGSAEFALMNRHLGVRYPKIVNHEGYQLAHFCSAIRHGFLLYVGSGRFQFSFQLCDARFEFGDPGVLLTILLTPAVPDLLFERDRVLEHLAVLGLDLDPLLSYAPLDVLHAAR